MRRLTFLLISFLTFSSSFSQVRLGIFGGLSNYQGDLIDKLYQAPRGAFGFTGTYDLSSHFSIRAALIFAKVAGADSLSESTDLRQRNLSFQSPVTELSLVGELNTLDLDAKGWSPYLFGGLAIYRFNPYTFDRSGNKIFLQPLGTEGQGIAGYPARPYSLTQIAIPFGGGIKYNISDRVRIALEVGLRKLFTDQLDDVSGNFADVSDLLAARGQRAVDISYRADELPNGNPVYPAKNSQRGSPKFKDYYYFTGIHLSFQLPEGNGGGGRGKKGFGCPTRF